MFQHFRTCQTAVFGDVTDEDDRNFAALGKFENAVRAFTDLADRAW